MTTLDETALSQLFTGARSQNGWLSTDVTDAELRAAYDIAKWGPTSMNTQPLRLLFLRSAEDKQRLRPALSPGNVDKVMTAPVVALICYDTQFHRKMAETFPHRPEASKMFEGSADFAEATAFRNGSLQAAYLMLALRAVGLDVGPMSGFDPRKVEAEFLAATTWRINMICGIGRGDPSKIFERLPRLHFDNAVGLPQPADDPGGV